MKLHRLGFSIILILFSTNIYPQKNLVANGGFEEDLISWNANDAIKTTPWVFKNGKNSAAIICFQNTDWVGMDQTVDLPKKSQALDVSAWIKGQTIVQGKDSWNTGVFIVEFYKHGKKLGEGVNIATVVGNMEWTLADKKMKIPDGADAIKLMIAMSNCTGTFFIDDVSAKVITLDEAGIELKNPDIPLVPDAAPSALEAQTKNIIVDKNATNATAALFYNLKKIAQTNILFGHQDDTKRGVIDSSEQWSNEQQFTGISRKLSDVKKITGAYPAVYGFDFSRITDYEPGNAWFAYEKDIARELTIDAYNRGGIITYCWHYQNPVSKKGFYWNDSPVEAVSQILPGGKYNDVFNKALEDIAAYDKTLIGKDGKLIPVIFRPFHEFDGDWFWWGKAHCTVEQYKTLYQYVVTYLRDKLGVHNFLYAWSPDKNFNSEAEYLERYPGDAFVDLAGIDEYGDMEPGKDPAIAAAKFKIVSDFAKKKNKLAALTETGQQNLPESDWFMQKLLKALQIQPLEFAYVLLWANDRQAYWTPYKGHPAEADFIKFKNDPYLIFGDKLPNVYSTP